MRRAGLPYPRGCRPARSRVSLATRRAAYFSPFIILVHSHLGLEWGATAAERFDDTVEGAEDEGQRQYSTRDGSQRSVRVRVHPDTRVEAVVEQSREAEMIQAIDRLRLIHNEKRKTVYILCSVPWTSTSTSW